MLKHKRGRKGPYPKSDDEGSGSEDDFEGVSEDEDDMMEAPPRKVSLQSNSFWIAI